MVGCSMRGGCAWGGWGAGAAGAGGEAGGADCLLAGVVLSASFRMPVNQSGSSPSVPAAAGGMETAGGMPLAWLPAGGAGGIGGIAFALKAIVAASGTF